MCSFCPSRNSFLFFTFLYFCSAANLTQDEIAEFYGLGRHFCSVPTDESVYRIAILVPFDPTLEDISATAPQLQDTKVAVYLAPALDYAINRIRTLSFASRLPRLEFLWGDTKCDVAVTLNLIFHYLMDDPVHAFIGPVCTFPLASAARIVGARFKRPLVTFGGFEIDLADKIRYPQLTRLGGHHGSLNGFLYTIFTHFGWEPRAHKNIALLHVRVDEATADLNGVSPQIVAAAASAFFVAKAILSGGGLGGFRVEGVITDHNNVEDMRQRMRQISSYGRGKLFGKRKYPRSFMIRWFWKALNTVGVMCSSTWMELLDLNVARLSLNISSDK
ncbi:unnamed protein product [Hydatigera taeniaeformis]|uniref:ANF_receptor domain-containing protein n=1 Tax=Hydatigena taeniaeformis TaxID=6205 RepID=A0A0R3XAR6_HYDTA|nr:unnamed protein product [Hydatigera taeniaeformis]